MWANVSVPSFPVGTVGWLVGSEVILHLPLPGETLSVSRTCSGPFSSLPIGFNNLQVCADPGTPENGFRTPAGGVFYESSVTRFHCQDGFKLKGSTKRLCMKHLNGTLGWVPSDRSVCVQEGKTLTLLPGGHPRGLLHGCSCRGRGCVPEGSTPERPSFMGDPAC